MVISKSPSTLQILNPETYLEYDIEMKDKYKDIHIGDEINVIKINNEFYPLVN